MLQHPHKIRYPDDYKVGQRIRQMRLEHGLSQEEVSQHIGVSCEQFDKYESGHNRISVGLLSKLSAYMEIPADTFLKDLKNHFRLH